MEQTTAKKWYDNNALVAVLCFFFFPVGLYALWKSSSRSQGWKIGGTIAVVLLIVVAVNSDDKRPKRNDSKSAEIPPDTIQPEVSVQHEDTSVVAAAEPVQTDQEVFLEGKNKSFKDYVASEPVIQERSGAIGSYKATSINATDAFLRERQNRLVDWTATVTSVDMDRAKECDISFSILPETIVGSKQVGFKSMDCRVTVEGIQATIKALRSKGVARTGALYDAVKALKENDEVVFTAKVFKVEENSEATGLNYSIVLYVELEDIRKR